VVFHETKKKEWKMEDAQTRSECGVIVKRLPSCWGNINKHTSRKLVLLTAFAINYYC
jgi:hypothetical protein